MNLYLFNAQAFGTSSCEDAANHTDCEESSSSTSNGESPLILPDIAPTVDDLSNTISDEKVDVRDTNDNDDSDGENIKENKEEDQDTSKDKSDSDSSFVLPFP